MNNTTATLCSSLCSSRCRDVALSGHTLLYSRYFGRLTRAHIAGPLTRAQKPTKKGAVGTTSSMAPFHATSHATRRVCGRGII